MDEREGKPWRWEKVTGRRPREERERKRQKRDREGRESAGEQLFLKTIFLKQLKVVYTLSFLFCQNYPESVFLNKNAEQLSFCFFNKKTETEQTATVPNGT